MTIRAIIFIFLAVATIDAYGTPFKIVTTFSILNSIVEEIAGTEKATVTTIVGPDGDAHVYQPRPMDAKNLFEADLVVVNGLKLEGWLDRLIKASGYKGPKVIASKSIEPLLFMENGLKIPDPHAWHSVPHIMTYVKNITIALKHFNSENADYYQKRSDEYLKKLGELDQWVRREIAKIPVKNRIIITAHDAFEYFAKEYNVKLFSPLGVSTDAEPSPKDLARIIMKIRQNDIKALFAETTTDKRIVEQIARETNIKVGGELYSDAISKKTGPAPTYIQMIRHNVGILVEALK
jgi:zinc/manganese transport system substrate-binding protein